MANEEKKELEDIVLPPPEPSKLGMILAAVNLLFTLGIGAVVFLQFQKDKHKESVTDISLQGEEAKEGAGEGKKEGGGHGEHGEHAAKVEKTGPKLVNFDQFTVNLSTTAGTPPRFARVMIAVEVPSDETTQELTQKMAQARNAILDLFNSKRPNDLATGEGRNFLKDEIKNALNSFLITGKVKGVYFSNFQISS